MSKTPALLVALGAVGVLAIACGSSGADSTFPDPNANGGDGGGSSGASGSSGNSSSGGPILGGDGGTSSGGSSGVISPDAACATSSAGTDALPVYLVFMFDRSGSMKFNPAPNNKWDACTTGLDSFFGDPTSKGLYASVQVFPSADECTVATYQTPLVTVTALPDTGNKLSAALAANGPDPNFGTPTLPALTGAIQYAQSVKAGLKNGEKVAVVLVTDGDPNDCNSTPTNVAAEAATVAATIPTYVIGVGPSLANLNQIAKGGGTGQAIIVSTSNPSQITQDFEKAVGQIKAQALGCDYTMPAPPAGQTLDVNAVNVVYTPAGQPPQTLPYSADCSKTNGWHYDNPAAPTKIMMCTAACGTLQADVTGGKLEIVFGCTTQGGVPR